jgi:hypothetical protein
MMYWLKEARIKNLIHRANRSKGDDNSIFTLHRLDLVDKSNYSNYSRITNSKRNTSCNPRHDYSLFIKNPQAYV